MIIAQNIIFANHRRRKMKQKYRTAIYNIAHDIPDNFKENEEYVHLIARHLMKRLYDLTSVKYLFVILDEIANGTKHKKDKEVIKHFYQKLKEFENNS